MVRWCQAGGHPPERLSLQAASAQPRAAQQALCEALHLGIERPLITINKHADDLGRAMESLVTVMTDGQNGE